jgi:hypothetical protein
VTPCGSGTRSSSSPTRSPTGIGKIERPLPKGRLLVAFDDGDEVMHPQEIELLAKWLDEPVRA